MSIAKLIRDMQNAGAPMDAILIAIEAIEKAQNYQEETKRKARDRKRVSRDKSQDSHRTVTGQSQDMGRDSHSDKVSPLSSPLVPPFDVSPTPPSLNPPITPPSISLSKGLPLFQKFWEMFPRQRRGGKHKAIRAWEQAIKRAEPEIIIAGLARYLVSKDIEEGFAKGAQAWLNDDGWENTYGVIDAQTSAIPESPEAIIATDKWTKIYIEQIRDGGDLTQQGISYLEQKLGNDWRKYA